jgi:hypothetical protein
MNDDEKEWRMNLKAGDEVYIMNWSWGAPSYETRKVFRTTPTLILVGTADFTQKFRKADSKLYGEKYSNRQLVRITEERQQEIRIRNLTREVQDLRAKMVLPDTEPELIELRDALKKYVR